MIPWIILGLAIVFVLFKIFSNQSTNDVEKKVTNKEVLKEEAK